VLALIQDAQFVGPCRYGGDSAGRAHRIELNRRNRAKLGRPVAEKQGI
jgi:hypothetical protein